MTLKDEILDYINSIRYDYDPEEINNLDEIIAEIQSDDLSDISQLSKHLLLRMIDDSQLYEKIDAINNDAPARNNLFDEFE